MSEQKYTVFYDDFYFQPQGNFAETLKLVADERATHVFMSPQGVNVSKLLARHALEAWLNDGHDYDSDPLPNFINKHLLDDDIQEELAERRTWNVT